jgi:putative transposase
VTLALEMALVRRSPPQEMRLHSDQGSTSTSTGSLARVAAVGSVVSMSRSGDWYENAALERFFSTLKGEGLDPQQFQTRQEARLVIFESIECFYHRERRHSTLHSLSPVASEQQIRYSSTFNPPKKSGNPLGQFQSVRDAHFLRQGSN